MFAMKIFIGSDLSPIAIFLANVCTTVDIGTAAIETIEFQVTQRCFAHISTVYTAPEGHASRIF